MKKKLLTLTLCLAFLFSACGKKAETPVNVKAENETASSVVQTPENVSSDNGQSTISRDEKTAEEAVEEVVESYEDSDNSESGYEDYDYSYDDYSYDDYSYDDGGLYYGDFDDGHGGYLCDYGYYTAEINTEEFYRTLSYKIIHAYSCERIRSVTLTKSF